MLKDKTFLAIIPARGGSKGIPRKNIRLVNGKPLIAYTIDAARSSRFIDRIIVSTDDSEIAEISEQYGAEIPFIRPSALASDQSTTYEVIRHAVQNIDKVYDYIVLLQPTQPLRQARHIDEAIELLVHQNWNQIVSVSPVNEHPILMRQINEAGVLTSLLGVSSTVRRQDFSPIYKVNGAIYINSSHAILDGPVSFNDNIYPYMMDGNYDLDIDEEEDLIRCEIRLMKENK